MPNVFGKIGKTYISNRTDGGNIKMKSLAGRNRKNPENGNGQEKTIPRERPGR